MRGVYGCLFVVGNMFISGSEGVILSLFVCCGEYRPLLVSSVALGQRFSMGKSKEASRLTLSDRAHLILNSDNRSRQFQQYK